MRGFFLVLDSSPRSDNLDNCRVESVESIPSILISTFLPSFLPLSFFFLDGFFLVCAGAKTTFFLTTFIIPSIDLFSFVYSFLKICSCDLFVFDSIISMVSTSWYSGVGKVYYLLFSCMVLDEVSTCLYCRCSARGVRYFAVLYFLVSEDLPLTSTSTKVYKPSTYRPTSLLPQSPYTTNNKYISSLFTTKPTEEKKDNMKSPHPGDFAQPSEPVFRDIERQSPTSKAREDPHTYNRDDRGRARVAHEADGRPRRKPSTSRSRSRSSGSAAKRLANSRPRSKMRRESRGKPDYRYAYF